MGGAIDQVEIDRLAERALAEYDLGEGAAARLVNVSENWTYRVEDAAGEAYALRIHRPGYHSAEEIASELTWMDAIREGGTVDAPSAVASRAGQRVVPVATPALGSRNVVLFRWMPGITPAEDHDLVPSFRTLGAVSARMHAQSRAWARPPGFVRFAWDEETTIGERGHWGRWQDGLGMGPAELAQLERASATLRARLERYGKGPERYGLCHCDIRLANLLVDGDVVRVIDFDDCGSSWFMYDFGTTVSFFETDPQVPELKAAWVEGYRSAAPLDPADEAELDTFVMLRRLLLTAWIGSHHAFATEAAELGAGFTAGTCELAERYLIDHA